MTQDSSFGNDPSPHRTVLLTGAAGSIGQTLFSAWRSKYSLRTLDARPMPGSSTHYQVALDQDPLPGEIFRGCDTVVHLAANPDNSAGFDALHGPNITALSRLFEACVQYGIRRMVFASSCHTIMGYPANRRVTVHDPVRPADVYGATKVFGEALGSAYHHTHGLEFIGIRYGSYGPGWSDPERILKYALMRYLWISQGDTIQLFTKAVETPGISYLLVFGTSCNETEYCSLDTARSQLGYNPQDSFEQFLEDYRRNNFCP